MNDVAVTHAEPSPDDRFARMERYATDPWFALAVGYGVILLAIAFSLSDLPAMSLARQVFMFIAMIIGGWGVWMRLRKPWDGPEPGRIYLLAFLVPVGLLAFMAFGALIG